MTVDVPKELQELVVALSKLVKESRKAFKDGFQIGQDLPALVTGCATELMAAIDGIEKVSGQWTEDRQASEKALALGLVDLKDAILSPIE